MVEASSDLTSVIPVVPNKERAMVGKRSLVRALAGTVKAIEARNYQVRQSQS
jgi:hypothetical protein